MIVNIIGPPCSGKSYIGSRYILEHPDWRYNSIDNCRIMYGQEDKAWEALEYTMNLDNQWSEKAVGIFIESSGLSWRLPTILKRQTIPIYTIALLASREVLHKRLAERQHKYPLPYRLRMDEKQSIDWVLQNIGSCKYPIDLIIRTDEISKEETYSLVAEKIEQIRLKEARRNE